MCILKPDPKDPLKFGLAFLGISERTFFFKASSKEDSIGWQQELKRHIEQSEGFKNKRSAHGIKEPWRYDNISEKQLIEQADTGDILLYKSNNSGGKLTRTLTGSQFDHVSMILKFESDGDELYLLESTGDRGVSLNKWSYIRDCIGTNEFYQRAVFRHINFDRNE